MKKIIVTTSKFTGYSTIFNVDGDTVDLHELEETDLETYTDLCLSSLPFDIKFDIFERVVLALVKAGLMKKALQTLLTSSSQICKIFYCKYIGNYDLDRHEILDHLISLFRLLEEITSIMFDPDAFCREELTLSLYCRNPSSIDLVDKFWPFGRLSQTVINLPNMLNPQQEITRVTTGPSYSDIVWVSGAEYKGIIYTGLLKGPILILEIYTGQYGRTLINRKTRFFSNVIKLLKICLGDMSGVYLVTPAEGFFGLLVEVV